MISETPIDLLFIIFSREVWTHVSINSSEIVPIPVDVQTVMGWTR